MIKPLERFFTDSKDLLYTPKCDNSVKRMAALYAIIALLGASIGVPFTYDNVYYGIVILSLCLVLYKGGLKLSSPFIALYIVILLNILIINIPSFFKPTQRAVLFLLLTLTCSSALGTPTAIKFRAYLFRYIVIGISIIGVGSFLCFFAGINLMASNIASIDDFEIYSTKGGWFSGLASHSMMLGPISMISALLFYFLYQKRSDKIYLLLFFLSAMSCVFSASRASLLGLGIAIIFNLFTGKVDKTVRKRMISIIALSALLTIPIAGIAFKGIINKQAAREMQAEGLNSRQGKFDYRIAEFESSPIFGVGFCAVDTNLGDDYNPYDGKIEPGTSHLAVLSMTGILGAAVYIFILFKAYSNTRKINTLHSKFVLACFIAFFMHAWFEGYVFAAGGFMALAYWLIIGQCIDCPAITTIMRRELKK